MTALRRSHTLDIWRQYRQKRGLARHPGHKAAFTFGRARENGGNCHSLRVFCFYNIYLVLRSFLKTISFMKSFLHKDDDDYY